MHLLGPTAYCFLLRVDKMRWSPVWTAASLLLGALGSASAFEITDGKVSVSTLDGSSRLSKR